MYDPISIRFFVNDPKAEEFAFQSTYSYASNNPILFIDKNGEGTQFYFWEAEYSAGIYKGNIYGWHFRGYARDTYGYHQMSFTVPFGSGIDKNNKATLLGYDIGLDAGYHQDGMNEYYKASKDFFNGAGVSFSFFDFTRSDNPYGSGINLGLSYGKSGYKSLDHKGNLLSISLAMDEFSEAYHLIGDLYYVWRSPQDVKRQQNGFFGEFKDWQYSIINVYAYAPEGKFIEWRGELGYEGYNMENKKYESKGLGITMYNSDNSSGGRSDIGYWESDKYKNWIYLDEYKM